MALFHYRYIDIKGKKKSGKIEAENIVEAKDKLRMQKVVVLTIKIDDGLSKNFLLRKPKNQIVGDKLITFTTQLSQLLIAGLPLYESLLSLEEQYRQESFHSLLLNLCDNIKKGMALSLAMGKYPESFDTLYCAMVAAGESVGALDTTLEKLAHLLTRRQRLKKQLITALLYPAILFCFSVIVCLLLLIFVIPSLDALFEDRVVNTFTQIIIGVSRFLIHQWPIYIPLIGIACGAIFYFFSSLKAKRWLQRQLLRVPLIKTLIVQIAMARFSRTMGTLLQGGVAIIKALQISRKVMHNPHLEEIVEQAERRIIEGSLLSKELKLHPIIPTLVPRMLAIGEEGGNAPLMFGKIADLYEEEVEKMLTRLTSLAQPVILVVMGGIVGLIMLAVLLPLTDVNAFM